jgi:3'(2'), 5'-bisphosphate nucleotidase
MTLSTDAKAADPELDEAIRIARIAARRVSAVYESSFAVEFKAPGDPVTRADRESSDIICASLAAAFPGDAVLSEEALPSDPAKLADLLSCFRVWLVDPLDGTREFTQRIDEFAVMIGLAVGGRATLGVVTMPATGTTLAGRVGTFAFEEDAQGARRRLGVSTVSDPREATLMVSRSHRPPMIASLVEKLGIGRVVPCGSVGVKIARLLLGPGDLYVHDGGGAKLWDACAPEAVLVAAGGHFSDLDGAPIDYRSADLVLRRGIVASNGALHDSVLAAV